MAAPKGLRAKQLINKYSSPDSVARKIVNRPKKRKSLKARIADNFNFGGKLIGKSKVTGRY